MTKEDIKQICQIYDNFRSERDAATIACNSDDTFWEHILATYNLSQPSLPSDLGKAAEKKARDIFESLEKHDIGEEKNRVLFGLLELEALALTFSHFGAEWMAGQGYSQEEIVEDKAVKLGYGVLPGISPIINLPDSFKPGDKVVVQIRKK